MIDVLDLLTPAGADFSSLGTPREWTCPGCGVLFTVYPALPFDHKCEQARQEPRVCRYFYRLKDDDLVTEFCVANALDVPTEGFPDGQYVATRAPDGTLQRWAKRLEGDLLVFRPPDGYAGGQGMEWHYDRRTQRHEPIDRPTLEKLALSGRVSVNF
jgi:hypothetical protein